LRLACWWPDQTLLSLLITCEVAPLSVEYLPGPVEEWCPGENREDSLSIDVMLRSRKFIWKKQIICWSLTGDAVAQMGVW
jgi:hypothetical protein